MPTIRVAVVGLGHMARHVHLPLPARLERRFTVTAVCDSQPGYAADVARRLGVPGSGVFVDCATSGGARDGEPGSLEFSGPLPHGRYTVRWHFLPDYPEYEERVRVHTEGGTHDLTFTNPYFFGADSGFERELLAFHALGKSA